MQTRLKPLELKRKRKHYPQINYIDKKGVQWIELNRGCKRQCPFCYSDPNFKVFSIPKITSNKVHIIGEGILYDPKIKEKFLDLGKKRVNRKVVYYGLSQGVDYRLLTSEIIEIMSQNRFGIINNKGNWYKGMRIAWDWGKQQEKGIKKTIDIILNFGYKSKNIIIFVLVNWLIKYEQCVYKLEKFKEWGVKIDDCTYNTTKKNFIPLYWKTRDYRKFRNLCRTHNLEMRFLK